MIVGVIAILAGGRLKGDVKKIPIHDSIQLIWAHKLKQFLNIPKRTFLILEQLNVYDFWMMSSFTEWFINYIHYSGIFFYTRCFGNKIKHNLHKAILNHNYKFPFLSDLYIALFGVNLYWLSLKGICKLSLILLIDFWIGWK